MSSSLILARRTVGCGTKYVYRSQNSNNALHQQCRTAPCNRRLDPFHSYHRLLSTQSEQPPINPTTTASTAAAASQVAAAQKTETMYERVRNRGPVSWPSLFLAGVAAASAVAYFQIERERRLETAMGKIVTSESDGWTPRPEMLAKRKFVATKHGWFPMADAYGAGECFISHVILLVVYPCLTWLFNPDSILSIHPRIVFTFFLRNVVMYFFIYIF